MEIILEKETQPAKLKVTIREEDYKPKVTEKVKEYSKKASIKGFRPGKVPPGLIQKMYGKSILVDEINHIVSHSINDYIKDNKLNIVGDPIPSEENNEIDWDHQKSFDFAFKIGLVPEFKLDLTNITLTRNSIKIDDKVVEETLDNLKNQFGEMIDTEVVEKGDSLSGELKQIDGDFLNEDVTFQLERMKDAAQKQFIGKKAGEAISFDPKKTFEDTATFSMVTGLTNEEAEKAEGEFSFTLKSVKRKKPAEVNQDFFDKVFGKDVVKTEDEFKNKLRETISENYHRESEALLTRDIEDEIVKKTEVVLPDNFLKEWLLKTNEGKLSDEQIDTQYEQFQSNLKWNLIRNKIVEDHDLKAEHEEILAHAKQLIIQQFGNMPLGPEMDETLNKIAENYLKQDNGKAYMQIFDTVMAEKSIDLLKEKLAIQEKTVSIDEFKKLAGAES